MRTRALTLLSLLSLVVAAGCASTTTSSSPGQQAEVASSGAADSSQPPAAKAAAGPAQARAGGGVAAAPAAAPAAADAAQQNLPRLDRMIIRTVSLTIGVTDVQEAYRQVERVALEQGGLIAGSQIRQEGDRTTATMTVRVPADSANVQTTLERLRGIAGKVVDEQAQAQDITEEHVDLESRLRNLRATEDSLLALLAKAQRVEDLIQIQRELTNVRGQIEQIQGRKQALERRSELATINLQIREQASFARDGWRPGTAFGDALEALTRAATALATLLIWLLVFAPLWAGALGLLWLVRRLIRSSRPDFRRGPAPATPTGA